MKIATRTLALLAVLALFCSLADARPIRGTFTFLSGIGFGVDANGNFVIDNFATQVDFFQKEIKFTRSGILINRIKQTKTQNPSGKRQVFRNVAGINVRDPEFGRFVDGSTRNLFIFPKSRRDRPVTMRGIRVLNPKKMIIRDPT